MSASVVKDNRPDIIGDIRDFTGLHVKGNIPKSIDVSDAKGRFSAFITGLKERSDPHRQLSVNLDLMMGNVLQIQAYNGEVVAAVFDHSGYDEKDKRPPRIDIDASEAKIIFRKLSDLQFQVEQNKDLAKVRGAVEVTKDIETGYKQYEFREPEDFAQMKEMVRELERKENDHVREEGDFDTADSADGGDITDSTENENVGDDEDIEL